MGPGQQIGPLTQRHQVHPHDRLESAGMTKGELPQQRSHGEGAYTAFEQGVHSTMRTMSMSSIQSAPAHMPATTVASFGAGLAPPRPIRGSAMRTFSASAAKAGLLGQRHHRHQPGTGHEVIIVEHRRTHAEPVRHSHRECLSDLDRLMRRNTNHPSSEGTVIVRTPSPTDPRQWIVAKPAKPLGQIQHTIRVQPRSRSSLRP